MSAGGVRTASEKSTVCVLRVAVDPLRKQPTQAVVRFVIGSNEPPARSVGDEGQPFWCFRQFGLKDAIAVVLVAQVFEVRSGCGRNRCRDHLWATVGDEPVDRFRVRWTKFGLDCFKICSEHPVDVEHFEVDEGHSRLALGAHVSVAEAVVKVAVAAKWQQPIEVCWSAEAFLAHVLDNVSEVVTAQRPRTRPDASEAVDQGQA